MVRRRCASSLEATSPERVANCRLKYVAPPAGSPGRHRRQGRNNWACLAERVLGGWPMTLRAALLLVILLTGGVAGLVVVLGFAGTACVAGISLALQLARRRMTRPT
jgi:hypothetical protein